MNNEMILASAGSGKTWQLTNRYIAIMGRDLLAGKEPRPEAILAVTFTRKAAGEFFDEILKKLAKGATSEEAARELAGEPDEVQNPLYSQLKKLKQSHYQELLVLFIKRMPRLFLGTLDSLFANIVRSFPAEFGLSGGFEILGEHEAELVRSDVFRHVFESAGDADQQDEFLEAFRLATLGSTEASVQRLLDNFISKHHHILLAAASPVLWGNEQRIWPQGNPWLRETPDYLSSLDALFGLFNPDELSEGQNKFWQEFRDQLPLLTPGSPPATRVKFFLEKFLENWDAIQAGECTFPVNRKKQTFGLRECGIISDITTRYVGDELRNHLTRTRGIWAILAHYESTYSRQVRRKGKLTFHDLEVLLAGSSDAPRPLLAQGPSEESRLRIDYRLDAKFEHWLLDEFQDTSYMQWSIIENLVDEAVQDLSGERSLFQVGDIKQAIYAWRGGDTQLFGDIAKRYEGENERALKMRDLSVSWRSGEDVIQPLNQVFGNKQALADLGLPQRALDQWHWTPHQVAEPNREHPGLTAYYQPGPADGEKVTNEDCYALALAILEEVQPIQQGLSCVILVQGNKEGREIVDYIRTHSPSNIPVASESDVAIAVDNPVTLAFLNLFHLAAHPGDEYAQGHLAISPLQQVVTQEKLTLPQLTSLIRNQVNQLGFEATLRNWMTLCENANLLDDSFSKQRLNELALAARIFDQSGELSIDRFLGYAKSYTLREPNSKSAVQVMTIHKSKGLTYDMAILPQLGGNALTTARSAMGVQRDRETRQVEWVLDLPRKAIAEGDEMLLRHRTQLEAEAGYEQLCKFYVALTRARYANYLIAAPLPPKSTSKNFVRLLDNTLAWDAPQEATLQGVSFQKIYESELPTSHPQWWQQLAKKDSKPAPSAPTRARPQLTPRPRPTRRTPSRTATAAPTKQRFSPQENTALEFGSAVHALFEQIEWADTANPLPNKSEFPQETLTPVLKVMSDPTCQQALSKPALEPNQTAELWREQNFEILLNDQWTSGTIDRVTIIKDANGKPLSASIIDFKTDQVSNEAEAQDKAQNYQSQMESYRAATSALLNLPAEDISAQLLFTAAPCLVKLY
ncbi:MAG: UvrD-helicase domain-containing protein [Roseibacillus sp.]